MPLTELLRFFTRTILSTCVPLFFFVNGYLLLSRPMELKKHTVKTVKLMALTCFWILFLLAVLQAYYGEYHDWQEMNQGIWDLKNGWNNQLWYMGVLMAIYLVFPLLKKTFDADRKTYYWFCAVAVFLVFGSSLLNLGVTMFDLLVKREFYLFENNLPVFHMFNPFGYINSLGLAYFCLGGAAWGLEERIRKIPALWRNLAAGAGLFLCCGMLGIFAWRVSLYSKDVWDVVWNGYNSVFTLGSVICLYVLSLNLDREIPALRLVSANTLGIYLVHDLVHKSLVYTVIRWAPMCTLPGTVAYATGLLVITLGICLVLKKIPLVKHLI